MGRKEDIVVGLDIGTTKTCAVVGEVMGGGVDIIGIGSHPSRGMRKGVVVNIDATVESIRSAIEEAELMAGVDIQTVYAGIAGSHIQGFNSKGVIAIKNKEVGERDIRRVVDTARAVAIPQDREVIHILPQEFIIDDQDGVREPIGMSGVRLEARVHIVTGAASSAQNIIKSCNRVGLSVEDIVLEQLASAEAVLQSDERELGVALVDIGGGTSDLAIFVNGALRYTAILPVGGSHLTGDIAMGLRTPMAEAERIKQKHGCAVADLVSPEETIEVPSVGGRKPRVVPRRVLAQISEPRMEEIFNILNEEIVRSGYKDVLAAGMVLTGGASLLEGLEPLAERVTGLPARIGRPLGIGGLVDVVNSPLYGTGVGLVLYGARQRVSVGPGANTSVRISRIKEWLAEFF
ncbi:MAG: cell division protein FtsA [Bdellovibrionota bacterium]